MALNMRQVVSRDTFAGGTLHQADINDRGKMPQSYDRLGRQVIAVFARVIKYVDWLQVEQVLLCSLLPMLHSLLMMIKCYWRFDS